MLGLERMRVALCAHEDAWDHDAEQTGRWLREVLHPHVQDVQHVGSTAIGSIRAKPIIDLVVGIADYPAFERDIPALSERGVELHPCHNREGHVMFLFAPGTRDIYTHHIHVVPHGGREWNEQIDFRDYMNAHPDEARAYDALKDELARDHADDRYGYTERKAAFIVDRIARAAAWRGERVSSQP